MNQLPHTLFEEELVQMILEQVGIIVFQAAERNGFYFDQVRGLLWWCWKKQCLRNRVWIC